MRAHEPLQFLQRAGVSFVDCGLLDTQLSGRIRTGDLLEQAQAQDLSITVIQRAGGTTDLFTQLTIDDHPRR